MGAKVMQDAYTNACAPLGPGLLHSYQTILPRLREEQAARPFLQHCIISCTELALHDTAFPSCSAVNTHAWPW